MSAGIQKEYGKPELVQLLTGVKNEGFMGWLDAATNAELIIEPNDMRKVHGAVMSYKANRMRNYGENGEYTQYFKPAFDLVEQGFATNNFSTFRRGCEELLSKISAD